MTSRCWIIDGWLSASPIPLYRAPAGGRRRVAPLGAAAVIERTRRNRQVCARLTRGAESRRGPQGRSKAQAMAEIASGVLDASFDGVVVLPRGAIAGGGGTSIRMTGRRELLRQASPIESMGCRPKEIMTAAPEASAADGGLDASRAAVLRRLPVAWPTAREPATLCVPAFKELGP